MDLLGGTVSHFQLLERLGGGGVAVVYKALDTRLGRPVALKLLAPGMDTREEARLRFLIEARAVSALDHPNVCTLYEIGETGDGRMFLAMAYVEGGTLRDRMRAGLVEPLEAALLAAQIAEGLGAAHARGIIHRDIKPGNILLGIGDGLVRIADFGVARLADQANITRDGQTVGTWSYMAPEQIRAEEVTPAADLWSLGIVLFEMIAGRRPFRGRNEPDLIRRILETDPAPLGIGGSRLAHIVSRALQKSTRLRYATAREMQEDLLEAAEVLSGSEPVSSFAMGSAVAPVGSMEAPLLHNLPLPPIGELLKGRHEELQALSKTLADAAGRQACVLHGLGGIGKTRLAIEYAWRSGRRYGAALFVLADSPEGLDSGLAALAHAGLLGLRERSSPVQSEVLAAVLRWLQDNPGWLLILDNVDTREARRAVLRLLPELTAGRVLITSRRRDWPAGVRRKALDPIRLQQAAEFLLERTGDDRKRQPDDAEQARRLAELLDGLPLALEQAGAYIVHRQVSFAEYLKAWEAESDAVLGWYDDGAMQYPASLAITWQRTFRELSPTARAVLRLVSFLAPDPVPAAMIESGEEILREAAALFCDEIGLTGQTAPMRLVRSEIAELRSLSLISGQGDLFAMHRLMQEVVRKRIPGERRSAWLELALRLADRFAPVQPDDANSWPVWDLLRPHAVELLAHADELSLFQTTISARRLMTYLSVLLLAKGLYAESEPLMRRVLADDEVAHGPDDPEVAGDLNNLAMLLKETSRPGEAEALMRRAIQISRATHEPSGNLTKELNGLALILMDQHKGAEAEELLQEALALDRKEDGEDAASTGRDLHHLALLRIATGRSREAEPLTRHALEIARTVHGPAHPKTARRLQVLAGLLRDVRRDEAERLAREALEIFEGVLGPDHPMTRSARHDLDTLSAA
jgi:tetratricopeptide (TPR) repeat protein